MMIVKKLKERRGNSYPYAISIALCLIFILCGIAEFARLMIIVQGTREAVQQSVIAVVTENYDEVYVGIRDGYAGAYQLSPSGWAAMFDEGDIHNYLDQLLKTNRQGNSHIKYASNKEEYRIYNLKLENANAPFATIDPDNTEKLNAVVTFDIQVPVRYGTLIIPPLTIHMRVKAGYTPKF